MTAKANTPIIIGVGEVRDKYFNIERTSEPADLILKAIRIAAEDALLPVDELENVDGISIVPPWTWVYPNLPGLIASKIHSEPSHLCLGEHGGNQPALLLDEAARRIASRSSKLEVVTGGESLASLASCQKQGKFPPPGWSEPDPDSQPIWAPNLSLLGQNIASKHQMGLPIHVYPMYENSLRAHKNQTQQQNQEESAKLYAEFDEISCNHPYSWRSGEKPRGPSSIRTLTKHNRMICTPYQLLLNAFNTVNLSAACVLTSVEHASRLGIPQDKWIYILGGAGTSDNHNFWERPNFHSSLSLEMTLDSALETSGLCRSDVGCYDFYSCFPIVPKLACKHLGLPTLNSPICISVLGGLTSFGGAGNNYSLHAIAEMTRQLRRLQYVNGVVLANGGCLTHHHAVCLSTRPREIGPVYPERNPLPEHIIHSTTPSITDSPVGYASIETYTVEYSRQGRPQIAHIVGRLEENNSRFVCNHGDETTIQKLADSTIEPIGLRGFVCQGSEGQNLFYLHSDSKI